ncbi:HNH endonuclease [Limoniibacter endophyticus]|uniref:HNH endonuclease n=1 Tax=Limoniibacter endophyticus TaxID=1565040 RepID=A0A8J3DFK6_9HYPH|nr:HNH endonuclease [Limoniibacter endophyticus]GHC61544.1 HNH endonuclease [Limoniibacter endophyticus]
MTNTLPKQPDLRSAEAVSYRRWYKLAAWERRRQELFARQPLCVKCLEREEVTVADTADHIVPHRGDPELFWSGELQSLCASCHSRLKQREELGQDVVTFGPDGWPVD